MAKKPMILKHFRLDAELDILLAEIAKTEMLSQGAIIRGAIRDYLNRKFKEFIIERIGKKL